MHGRHDSRAPHQATGNVRSSCMHTSHIYIYICVHVASCTGLLSYEEVIGMQSVVAICSKHYRQ